jgi:hypothetical protein
MISVIIPTITGREQWYARCLAAYYATSPADTEYVTVLDRPTCGVAWNEGAARGRGGYLHFSADDLEPHPGWWEAAIGCVEAGGVPSARILNADGSLQSCGEWGEELPDGTATFIARVPFCSRDQWDLIGPIIETHYYTDNHFTYRGLCAGIPTVIVRAYLFTHHFASEGRLDGVNGRFEADRAAYDRAMAAV